MLCLRNREYAEILLKNPESIHSLLTTRPEYFRMENDQEGAIKIYCIYNFSLKQQLRLCISILIQIIIQFKFTHYITVELRFDYDNNFSEI